MTGSITCHPNLIEGSNEPKTSDSDCQLPVSTIFSASNVTEDKQVGSNVTRSVNSGMIARSGTLFTADRSFSDKSLRGQSSSNSGNSWYAWVSRAKASISSCTPNEPISSRRVSIKARARDSEAGERETRSVLLVMAARRRCEGSFWPAPLTAQRELDPATRPAQAFELEGRMV